MAFEEIFCEQYRTILPAWVANYSARFGYLSRSFSVFT